jgi:hypothetical protein
MPDATLSLHMRRRDPVSTKLTTSTMSAANFVNEHAKRALHLYKALYDDVGPAVTLRFV